jgi:hypothetical protein
MSTPGYIIELDCGRLAAEVEVNGWRVAHNRDPDGRTTHAKINPWLLDGDNVIGVRLGWLPGEPEGAHELTCVVALHKVVDDASYANEPPMLLFRWYPDEYPLADQGLTRVYEHRFVMRRAFGPFAWTGAMPYLDSDRPQVTALVREVHDAIGARDRAALLRLQKLKLEEMGRSVGVSLQQMIDEQDVVFDEIFAGPVQIAPLDPERLHMRSGAGGRLVQVEREDGDMRVLPFVTSRGLSMSLPLCVANLGGRWTLVR